ncbi:NAD(P)/FAD-dependent oxidoreductase [Patulibacter sp. SYSU D01012]|uniref:flavin-containing monooxygenase n=1 Tax=Patulibacter sp. SYSU D01012 TaxID=2817381 RepID=UPI001B307E31
MSAPTVAPAAPRASTRAAHVVIVGAGFSGIGMGVALQRAGIPFTILDRADDLGGVWHANTYPGAACDIPSYLYSFSFAQRRDWTRPCSPHDEIKDYLRDVATAYGLLPHLRLGTEVTSATYDEATARWTVTTAAGETLDASAVVLGCGQLSRPAWPRIPGMDRFAGHAFHSAEWDHDHDLRGRRVAVIGTGASAVQFVPPVAEVAGHVDVFQRSPSYMLPRRNRAYAPWAHAAIRRIPGLQRLRRWGVYTFCEITTIGLTTRPLLGRATKLWSQAFLRLRVRDRALRRKLTPDYPIGCKRILFSSRWYPALQRENVDLVTDDVVEITERGVRTADGREREADTIVYATGFKSQEFVVPIRVTGAEGRDLHGGWAAGAEAHHGMTVAGFPSLFLLYGPNTNLSVGSIIVMIEAQIGYVLDALRLLERTGADALDVRPEVQAASNEALQRDFDGSVWTSCSSWYRNAQGRVVSNWPHLMREYERLVARVRPEEFRLVRAGEGAATSAGSGTATAGIGDGAGAGEPVAAG